MRRLPASLPWPAVMAIYALFSVYATWPALPHLLGDPVLTDDASISAWGLWWFKEALAHLDNPWYTRMEAAPEGVYLAFHALVPLAGALLAPVTAAFGPVAALGLTKLLLPPVAALFAQRAAHRVGIEFWPSVIAGALYGFATVIVWKTTFHLNFGFGAPLPPLALLAAARASGSSRRRDWLALGAVLGAAVLVDGFIAFLCGLVAVSYLLATGWLPRSRHALGLAAIAILAAACVASPQLYMVRKAQAEGQYDAAATGSVRSYLEFNTSVETLASPGNVRSFVPGRPERWSERHDVFGASSAYGWGLLALALAGAALARRRPPAAWWALGVAIAATLLALGPELTLAGDPAVPLPVEMSGVRVSAAMPFTWLVQLPLVDDFRVSARYTMLGVLGLSMLAGFGVQALARRRGRWAPVLLVALLALATLEAGWPDGGRAYETTPSSRSGFYAPVRADRSGSAVVDVPYGLWGAGAAAYGTAVPGFEFMLRATEHGHPIVGGWVTRLSTRRVQVAAGHRFLADLVELQTRAEGDSASEGGTAVDPAAGRADADAMRVRWAVVWPSADAASVRYLRAVGFREAGAGDGLTLMRR